MLFPRLFLFPDNKWFICLLLAALLLLTPDPAMARDYQDTGVVVTGSKTWKPYSYHDDNDQPAGFFVDIWNKWSEKTGIPVTFRLVTWSDSIALVANRECDIQSGLFYSDERAETFIFSTPVSHTKAVKVVRSDVECTADEDLLRWGGVNATAEKEFADKLGGREATGYVSSILLFKALVDNRIQAFVDDWSTVSLLGTDLGISDRLKICETVYDRELRAVVRKENRELLRLVDEGLAQISDAERRVIVNKWFVGHEDDGPSTGGAGIPLLISVLLVFVSVLTLFVWQKKH